MSDRPRRCAYDLLEAVAVEDSYANLTMPALLRSHGLHGRDAAFATELAMGTLRWRGLFDAIIISITQRPMDRIDAPLRDVLRLGCYQVLCMRVPDHAAVNSSVELAAELRFRSATGFVNATLRQVCAKSLSEWQEIIGNDVADATERLAQQWSHPRWIVAALRDALGQHSDEIGSLLAANNESAGITAVSRSGAETTEALLVEGEPGRYSPFAVRIHRQPSDIAAIADGRAGVQDEGSQLVALAMAHAPLTGSDNRWLDLCAGPGGKAALLKWLGSNRGANLTCVEITPHRVKLIDQALQPVAGSHHTLCLDGRDASLATGDFDRVIVDAPCTGLGVLKRRAESRWRREPADVGRLTRIQRELLTNAMRAVRPGGVVAYATCSPHLAETEFIVEDVMKADSSVRLLSAGDALLAIADLGHRAELEAEFAGQDFVRLWPHRHHTDGMFLALLTRD